MSRLDWEGTSHGSGNEMAGMTHECYSLNRFWSTGSSFLLYASYILHSLVTV